jgi:hypothetical protein
VAADTVLLTASPQKQDQQSDIAQKEALAPAVDNSDFLE